MWLWLRGFTVWLGAALLASLICTFALDITSVLDNTFTANDLRV